MKDFLNDDINNKKKINNLKKSLKDIAPVKDKLSQIKDGERDIEELINDSTFEAELNRYLESDLSDREKKKIIQKILNEMN